MNYVIMKLRVKRIQCPVMYQCALLVSYLKSKNIDATVKSGYIEFAKMHCPHVWVETSDGTQLDIATAFGLRIAPQLSKFGIKLTETPSENSKRMDTEDEQKRIVEENISLYDLYTHDVKKFWKERPMQLRGFKV